MKKGIVFAGGEFSLPADIKDILNKSDCTVCADSGFDRAVNLGVRPHAVIGDMDSVERKLPGETELIRLNCEKDDTDTEACINYLIEKGCKEITLLCALGGRKDHELANIMLTVYAAKKGVKLTIRSGDTEIFAVDGQSIICGKTGDLLSLVPVFGDAEGVSLSGLKYPLENACLEAGKTVGISNEFVCDTATVSVEKGMLIAIKTKR